MQKVNLQETWENAALAAVVVLFFSAIVLFSYWFTQG